MNITEIMSSHVECVKEQDAVVDAALKMRELDVGALPVIDSQDQLSGIVTDRDIVLRAIADGKDPAATAVGQVMTKGAITCHSDQSVEQAAWQMESNQVRRLVIVDNSNRTVGIVSLGDIAVKNPDMKLAGEVVEEVSRPAATAA